MTASVTADAMRVTVHSGCSDGRRTTIGVSPQPATAAVASARTDPRLASRLSARTTGTPSVALGTKSCADEIQGGTIESGKIESGGG
ncbi:hypothetical protein ABZ746_30500 [Streptomyces sp. NPDC020096]